MRLIIISQEFILEGPEGPRGLGFLEANNLLSGLLPCHKLLLARPDPRQTSGQRETDSFYANAKPLITEDNREIMSYIPLPSMRGKRSLLSFAATYRLILNTIQPGDVVLLRNLSWMQYIGYLAARRKKAKVICHLLGAYDKQEVLGTSVIGWRTLHELLRAWERVILNNSDAVALVSPWLEQSYGLNRSFLRSLTHLPDSSLTEDWLNPIPKPHTSPLELLFVGRLEPVKGIINLLEAARRACAEQVPIRVHIVGTGSQQQFVREWIDRHELSDQIKLYGFVSGDALKSIHDASHILVLPSISEGLPVVVLEGMARSKALIVSDIPAHRAILEEGSSALFVPCGDADAIFHCICKLALDETLYLKLSTAAHEKSKSYLVSSIMKKWSKLVEDVEKSKG